jgi:hypothetical protein
VSFSFLRRRSSLFKKTLSICLSAFFSDTLNLCPFHRVENNLYPHVQIRQVIRFRYCLYFNTFACRHKIFRNEWQQTFVEINPILNSFQMQFSIVNVLSNIWNLMYFRRTCLNVHTKRKYGQLNQCSDTAMGWSTVESKVNCLYWLKRWCCWLAFGREWVRIFAGRGPNDLTEHNP